MRMYKDSIGKEAGIEKTTRSQENLESKTAKNSFSTSMKNCVHIKHRAISNFYDMMQSAVFLT